MRQDFGTFARFSAAALFAAFSTPGLGAQGTPPAKPSPAPAKPSAAATKPPAAEAKHVMMSAEDLKWGPAPPSLPPGAQAAVLDGDPTKAGLFVVRLKFPDGYKVAPHWHPTDEHVVVIAGSLSLGLGNKVDDASMHALKAGGYSKMPRRTNHYAKATGETIIQLTAMGPFAVTYVNPQDDPRKKTSQN
jgi:quercetin dioxygenase-like cupin family protein